MATTLATPDLVGHQHVGVAFDDGEAAGGLPGEPGLVQAVDQVTLAKERRVAGVNVLGRRGPRKAKLAEFGRRIRPPGRERRESGT